MGDPFSHLGLDAKEKKLAARFLELARISWERGITRSTAFLDEREQTIAACAASAVRCDARFFGGFCEAERRVCVFSGTGADIEDEDFPIRPVTLSFRREFPIGHRDILGTLMGMQLNRETVGDILVGDGVAVLFVTETVAPVILSELTRVGRVGVSTTDGAPDTLPAVKRELRQGIAASLRMDCVTAMLLKSSRSEAVNLIRAGKVARGGQVITAPSAEAAVGDTISIRGSGKFRICGCEGHTRSGRLHVEYEKYT